MLVHCQACQFHMCSIKLAKEKPMSPEPSTSFIEPDTSVKKRKLETPLTSTKPFKMETPLVVPKATPARSASNRKRDKVNKLQRLAALHKAGEANNKGSKTLSSFLTSLNM